MLPSPNSTPPPPRKQSPIATMTQQPGSVPTRTLYHPSIYTYTCRGAWFVSSQDQFSEGNCRGIKSRLELLADMDASNRETAIKAFTYMTDYELEDDGDPPPHDGSGASGSGGGGGGANGLNQKTKSILISPALIYKEKVEPPPPPRNRRNRQKSAVALPEPSPPPPSPSSSPAPLLPEEELIKRQKWSCYGSTEVELLVLKNSDSGVEHIAAVAPRNVGVSIRKIDADEGSITSIGIGWLNIVVDAGPAFVEDDEEAQQQQQQQSKSSQKPLHQPSAIQQQQQQQQQLSPHASSSSIPTPEEVPPRPSQDSIAKARTYLTRYYEFAGKVGEQMKMNVHFLRDTMQDDFVGRSAAAGHKIVNNLPRTVDRTASFFQKMVDRWMGGGGGGGGGGENGRGSGGPDL